MNFEYYGAVIALVAITMFPLAIRLKKRLMAVVALGWGRLYAALTLFVGAGVLLLVTGIPQFMGLFMPVVAAWLRVTALLMMAAGLGLVFWSLGSLSIGVRRMQQQQMDEEGWQKLYSHLQEIALQPFSFVEILNLSLKQLQDRSEVDGAVVMLFKENTSELILAAFSELSPETAKKLEKLQVSGDVFGRAQKLGQPQLVGNLSDSDKMTEQLFADTGYLSAAVFPLRSHDKTIGSVGLLSTRPFHFNQNRVRAIGVATAFLGTVLVGVRQDKEISKLRDRLRPSEEAKRITDELFFRRGIGGDLQLREALEFERVRKFFDADCIKLAARDADGEFRIKASSGGAERGLLLEQRKLTGISRAVKERKLLLMTSPQAKPAGGGYDSMPRQVLFVPVPYPDRDDLVLLLESESASLEFSREKLSAVRVASVYLADLYFLFLEKRQGERYRNSIRQLSDLIGRLMQAGSAKEIASVLHESVAFFLPSALLRLIFLRESESTHFKLLKQSGLAGLSSAESESDVRKLSAWGNALQGLESNLQKVKREEILATLPDAYRGELERLLPGMPESLQQVFAPVEVGRSMFGFTLLCFDESTPIQQESVDLYCRLADLAATRLQMMFDQEDETRSAGLAPGALRQLDNLNNMVTRVLATAQLLEEGVRREELPSRYRTGLEKVGDAALQMGEMIKSMGQQALREAAAVEADAVSGAGSADLEQWLDRHRSELDIQNGLVDAGLRTLVSQLFDNGSQGSLHISTCSAGQHAFFQLTLDPELHGALTERANEENGWIASESLTDLPESIRMLGGEMQLGRKGEDITTLIWRLPRKAGEKERRTRLRILGIDDQEAIRDLLQNIISALGHQVKTVSDSGEAMELMQREPYDVVIVEVALPGQSGWEIARQVKAYAPRTPVIMLSGWDYQEQAAGEDRQHADFVLTKPFKMEQLRQAITDAAALISG